MLQKLKSFLANDAFYYSVLIVFVAVASFGLGRQSVIEKSYENGLKNQNIVTLPPHSPPSSTSTLQPNVPTPIATASQSATVTGANSGEVVASKSGSKYHLLSCPGAKQIKPENLISFSSANAAQAAGYTPAANCKGL